MPVKVPALTLSLVKDEMFKRGWELMEDNAIDGLKFRRGEQWLRVSSQEMRSSKFRMNTFMRDLDVYDHRSK